MIDIEHCLILGAESVDSNSINRCMFNLFNKIGESTTNFLAATSENVPESPFFSGGYENAIDSVNGIPYLKNLGLQQMTSETEGIAPRLYSGDINIFGSQDNESFITNSVSGTYYYSSDELSTFVPTVSSLLNDTYPIIFKSILDDDTTHMSTGVSSLGIASSPVVKYTSYLTCSNSGISFGTVTFKRNNGDRQNNIVSLNIIRDLIGIDGVGKITFFTIGNGVASGIKDVSEDYDMVSDISPCNITYESDTDVIISNITKNDFSDSIYIDKETGRILDEDEEKIYGKYIELSNNESVLNFFVMFDLNEDALQYSSDLWCFYVVNDFDYAKNYLYNANSYAENYFKYKFENFEAADCGKNRVDGSHEVDDEGCTIEAVDAFNGCYNATFESLCWISPRLKYADRMFKECTHATFDSFQSTLNLSDFRSGVSMFENCKNGKFNALKSITFPRSSRLSYMFAECNAASFDNLESISVGGDCTKMFYDDYHARFHSLSEIKGSITRLISMFEGCDNADFYSLETIASDMTQYYIDATKMFYGLTNPVFDKITKIELGYNSNPSLTLGYDGTSMFEGCRNASFENLTDIGCVVNGTRMFYGLDPDNIDNDSSENKSTFENINSLGSKLLYGESMFANNVYLAMHITDENSSVKDGTSMFVNTSSVIFDGSLDSLLTADNMFQHCSTAIVYGNISNIKSGQYMFSGCNVASVYGTMNKLVDGTSMFMNSDHVYMAELPETVESMTTMFADISVDCKISEWGGAANYRYATGSFINSNNISISGDILKGKIVDTSEMFSNASSDEDSHIVICNTSMNEPTDDEHKFYAIGSGEKYTFVKQFDSNGVFNGSYTLLGDADEDTLKNYVTANGIHTSFMCVASIGGKSATYNLYSIGGNSSDVSLVARSFTIDENHEFEGKYYYSKVTKFGDKTSASECAISYESVIDDSENSVTGCIYFTDELKIQNYSHSFNSSTLNGSFSIFDDDSGVISAVGRNQIKITYSGHNITYTYGSYPKIEFDFVQYSISSDENPISLVIKINENNRESSYYCIKYNGSTKYIEQVSSESEIEELENNLLIKNCIGKYDVTISKISKYDNTDYGYIMYYSDLITTEDKIAFSAGNVKNAMIKNPKNYMGNEYSLSIIFNGSKIDNPTDYTLKTSYSIGTSDMEGYWKYAYKMFYNVVEDSLLSGYYCFSDTSLEDVSYMFALDEKVENDRTFDYSGYLLQNLSKSNVTNMSCMMLNRYISNPDIFVDLYSDKRTESTEYISFQISETLTDAESAFCNCEIYDGDYDEIGLMIPSSLTAANDMFNGYVGPAIRFGYESNGCVYIADGIQCSNIFNGCSFVNDNDEQCRISIPSIYLDLFSGSDFSFSTISSIDIRNGCTFASPYSNSEFFYNDKKILGCSTITMSSFTDDILDWFVSDTYAIESVYLATVIGPVNTYSDGELEYDYRLMTAEKNETWLTRMSYLSQFNKNTKIKTVISHDDDENELPVIYDENVIKYNYDDIMLENMIACTNDFSYDKCSELTNEYGRSTCMFNLSLLFAESETVLGDKLHEIMTDSDYLKYDSLIEINSNKSYRNIDFDNIKYIDSLEMPFMFCGLESATFNKLIEIGDSAMVGYGAFMNCENATFDSLTSVSFNQNYTTEMFLSGNSNRFVDKTNCSEWIGNYDNMFANCSNSRFDNLKEVTVNSYYATLSGGDNVLMWLDENSEFNFSLYATYDYNLAIGVTVSDETEHIMVRISKSDITEFMTFDTGCVSSDSYIVKAELYTDSLESNVLVNLSIIDISDTEIEKIVRTTDEHDEEYADFNMCIESTGVMNIPDWRHKGYYHCDEGRRIYDMKDTKESKNFITYHNANGYHILDTDENFNSSQNYNVKIVEYGEENARKYQVEIWTNKSSTEREYKNMIQTGIDVYDDPYIRIDMCEINGYLTPVINITDKNGGIHFYEILSNGEMEVMQSHPSKGDVTSLGKLEEHAFSPFTSYDYADVNGQKYTITTTNEDDGSGSKYYTLVLKTENGTDVAVFGTNLAAVDIKDESGKIIEPAVDPTEAKFSIGSYAENGLECIIIIIYSNTISDNTIYRVYKDYYDGTQKQTFKYIEESTYYPGKVNYRLLNSFVYADRKNMSHKAFVSGMFRNSVNSTFEKLNTVSMPVKGSCAGMFANNENMILSSIKFLVLPHSDYTDSSKGYERYKGVFDSIPQTSISFTNLKMETTNIYSLGYNNGSTLANSLFYGMIDNDGKQYGHYYDETYDKVDEKTGNTVTVTERTKRLFTYQDAIDIGLNTKIADRFSYADIS